MLKKEQLLEVYHHKNIGYVPCVFTDMDFCEPVTIKERPAKGGDDWFGVSWTYDPCTNAPMITIGTQRLKDITKWKEELTFPDLKSYDWETLAKEETKNWDRENKLSYMFILNGPFERMHTLMGFEEAFIAMYEEPEAFEELLNAIVEYKIELIEILAKYYKPDILVMHDDFGAGDRMLMSPDMWREFLKVPTKRLIDAVHAQGLIYEHHSCGYIEPIFDELVELGIDAIDPLQPSNNVRALKEKYQDRVTFVGGFNTQETFDKPGGATEEEIREETKRVLNELAPGGSYVAFPVTITTEFRPIFLDELSKHAYSFGDK